MWKKSWFAVVFLLLAFLFPTQAQAEEAAAARSYALITYLDATLDIWGDTAVCIGEIETSETAEISLTVELQEYDGRWETVAEWQETKTGVWLRVSGEYDDLTPDGIYQVRVTADVSTEDEEESDTAYSNIEIY